MENGNINGNISLQILGSGSSQNQFYSDIAKNGLKRDSIVIFFFIHRPCWTENSGVIGEMDLMFTFCCCSDPFCSINNHDDGDAFEYEMYCQNAAMFNCSFHTVFTLKHPLTLHSVLSFANTLDALSTSAGSTKCRRTDHIQSVPPS